MCERTTCIYCKQDDPTKFKGVEHVIPQAFGRFGSNTPTLDCVCDDCNEHFGKNHDLYLARETLEGLIRYRKGLFSSAARPQKHLEILLDAGPETGQFAGLKVVIDGTTGQLMKPKGQFHILNQTSGITEIYFKHQIDGLKLPEEEYGKPGDGKIKGSWKCCIYSMSQQEHDEIVGALRSNGIPFIAGEPFRMPEPAVDEHGSHTLPVSIRGEIGSDHRRAHAKIFLNLIAWCLGSDEAMNSQWDSLRRYARYGEGTIKCRVSDRELPSDKEGELRRLIGDSIIVLVENLNKHVVGTIRFYGNQTYQYVLRENDSLRVGQQFGLMFTHGKEPMPMIKTKVALQ